ncbi:PQQ-binding-like beta-propeller repeat protein [bacterium]|nr:PQQ-binding-like beta-propeller repeat protein [bacterium]
MRSFTIRSEFSVLWRVLLVFTLLFGGLPLHHTHAADIPVPPRQDTEIEPAAVDGPTARSAIFNGTNAYVEVSPTAALHPTDEITIEAWVWRDDVARCETVLGKDFQTSYWLGFCSGKVRFYRAGIGTNVDSTSGVPARRWAHVAVTYDGSNVRFYIDGALDRSVAVTGSLTSNTLALGIGADLGASFPDYYYKGLLDEVRLWNVARSQADIQADMYSEVDFRTGLVGVWRLNGNAVDSRARFSSTARGDLDYRSNGVLPRAIVVRRNTTATMTVDGVCSVGEYGNAERVTIDHEIGPLPTVFAQYNDANLYICMQGLPRGSTAPYAAVNIDRDFSRDSSDQPGDYRFRIDFDGTLTALEGNDGPGYAPFTPPVGSWDGATTNTEFNWSAEYRFSAALLDITTWTGQTIGVDFGHYQYNNINDEFHWPVDGSLDRPDRWAPMTFSASSSTTAPTYNFSGHVRRQRDNAGIENATVYLFASSPTGTSLAGTAQTNASGAFNVSYQGYGTGIFILQEEDPRGMRSVSAAAGTDGTVINANAIRFDAAAGSYQPVTFVDTDARPVTRSFDRHYLIVHGGDVRQSDLWPLVEQKRGQGYQIEIVNTSLIESTVSGRDLAEKIRNWLKDRWQAHQPAPVYALLVGRADVIPVRDVAWNSEDLPDPSSPSFSPAWPTDWYYADLDSNWDKNNNDFFGEDLNCMWSFNADCPADRNTLEGPFGGPGNEDNWTAEIAIGRLGVSTPAEVQAALRTAVSFERSGALDKSAAVLAGGLWGWDGRSWVTDEDGSNGRYIAGGQARSDGSLYYDWDGSRPFGLDTATALAGQLEPLLSTHMTDTITLYESSNPHNDPNLSPTAATPDIALSHANIDDVWQNQRFGLMNVAGHGNENGVWGQSWINDWNDNKQIEQPSNPADCPDDSCWDLSRWYSYIDRDVPAPAGLPSVVYANACGTGGVSWSKITNADGSVVTSYGPRAIGGDMMSLGKSAAWLGSLAVVPVTGVDNAQTVFNRELLQGRLLGDATWKSFNVLATDSLDDIRTKTMTLFGDPAMSYWGNGADALAPWPQDSRDWWASSATPYHGPTVGRITWTLNDVTSPPTVNRDGNVVAGRFAQSAIVAPDGSVVLSNTHGAVPPFPDFNTSAAIGTDGVYFAEARYLHVLAPDLQIRDVISLDAAAIGAPRLGPDGVVYVPTDQGMQRIVGRQVTMLSDVTVSGTPAYAPDGAVLWTTADAIVRHAVDRWGNDSLTQRPIGAGMLTPPVVTSQGVYVVGGDNGLLFTGATNPLGSGWSVNTGAAIVHKATVGFDDTVYVGNNGGDVIALTPTGSEVWRTNLGTPIAATPTTDGTQLFVSAGRYLYALDLVTGSQNWRLDLGGTLGARSQPVIGSGRMLYVTRADNVLVGVRPDAWLTVPSDVLVQAGIGQLSISWRDNTVGENGFRVDACTLTGDCTETVQVAANVESAVLSGLDPDLPYFVRVLALGDQNSVAAGSASASAEMQSASEYALSGPMQPLPALPAVPTVTSVQTTGSESLRVNWSFGGDVDALNSFRILRSNSEAGSFVEVAQVGADQRSWRDEALSPNSTRFYKVSSVNAAGESAPSAPAQGTTRSVTLPAPTSFTARLVGGQVILTWLDNADGESGYIVERSVPGEALYTPIAVLAADAVTFSDDAELFGGRFEYRVKAVDVSTESSYAETSVNLGAAVNLLFLPNVGK